jgi:Flp pilus assembly protein TadD
MGDGESLSAGPLGQAYGLDDAALDLLGEAFAQIGAKAGLDGAAIFARLRAGQSLAAAMSLSPHTVGALYARAHQWFSIGRIEKAAPLFRALVTLDPQGPEYWIGHGACLRHGGRLVEAQAAFAAAALLRPNWGLPYFHLLGLAIHRGDRAAARELLAAFDAAADTQLPKEIVAEAARIRSVLATDDPSARVP